MAKQYGRGLRTILQLKHRAVQPSPAVRAGLCALSTSRVWIEAGRIHQLLKTRRFTFVCRKHQIRIALQQLYMSTVWRAAGGKKREDENYTTLSIVTTILETINQLNGFIKRSIDLLCLLRQELFTLMCYYRFGSNPLFEFSLSPTLWSLVTVSQYSLLITTTG